MDQYVPLVNDDGVSYNPEQVWKALTVHFPFDGGGSDGPTAQSKI